MLLASVSFKKANAFFIKQLPNGSKNQIIEKIRGIIPPVSG
jgi:hypothetical protein